MASVGCVLRFPDGDYQYNFTVNVPKVGHMLRAKGESWIVTNVEREGDGIRANVVTLRQSNTP